MGLQTTATRPVAILAFAAWTVLVPPLSTAAQAQGTTSTDRHAELAEKVEGLRSELTAELRRRDPDAWAEKQSRLGDALTMLVYKDPENPLIDDAVAAHRAALTVWTRDSDPTRWAQTNGQLAITHFVSGLRSNALESFVLSVILCHEALEVLDRQRHPRDWAAVQKTLKLARLQVAASGASPEDLRQLITEAQTMRASPGAADPEQIWAATQFWLGRDLVSRGQRSGDATVLRRAIAALRAALTIYTQDDTPATWVRVQEALGSGLLVLGSMEEDAGLLDQAEAAYQSVLDPFEHNVSAESGDPRRQKLATLYQTIGMIRFGQARIGGLPHRYDDAAEAFQASLDYLSDTNKTLIWGETQKDLATALRRAAEHHRDAGRLKRAAVAYRAALTVFVRERFPRQWVSINQNLGATLFDLADLENDGQRFTEAAGAYAEARDAVSRIMDTKSWADAAMGMARAQAKQATLARDADALQQSIAVMKDAADVYRIGGHTSSLDQANAHIDRTQQSLKRLRQGTQ